MHNFKYKNMKFKHLIDDMVIDFRSSYNFARMQSVRIKSNPMVDL